MPNEEIIPLVTAALEKYPLSRPQDMVKLLYQSEFGPAHAIADPEAARSFLWKEYASVTQEEGPLCEYIGGDRVRVNLKTLDANGVSPDLLAEAFIKSAVPVGDVSAFAEKLTRLAEDPLINALMPELAPFIADYVTAGCPAMHHSEAYRAACSPAYRVVSGSLLAELFAEK
ncbi:MAG: hypothetical protein IKG85_06550 [Clostridia bacterium]|nr:hypothetical protein [Clostridia bacterium]